MKIIERGSGWGIEQKCTGNGNGGGGCGSILLVEEQDIYQTDSYDYLGEHDIYYTFKCPICGKETDIPSDKLPPAIKKSASKRLVR